MTRTVRKVLFAHPSAELYGSDRMLLESVRALARTAAVVVTVPGDGPLVPLLREAGATVRAARAGVLRKAALRPAGALRLLADLVAGLVAALRLLRQERPDVVVVNTVTVPGWLLAARLAGRRTVCHVHEAEEGLPGWLARGTHAPLLLAHAVVANSGAARQVAVAAQPRLAGRATVVHNGVPGPPEPFPVRDAPGAPARLVLVGRLSPRKGTDLALEAVAELLRRGRAVRLDLVGDAFPGYEWFVDELRARAAALDGAVALRGFCADAWSWYEAADVVLVPSRAEPFGNVAVEAMLAGRPLVAARAQGLAEVVRHGETGLLVAPDDALALADAVADVLDDWPAARARALAARADAQARFAPAVYGDRLRRAVLG